MAGGAPLGNKNAAKTKEWQAAIYRALEKRGLGDRKVALDDLAEKLLQKCSDADLAALKEFGDRMDGKPAQSVSVGGSDELPPISAVLIRAIDATRDRPPEES